MEMLSTLMPGGHPLGFDFLFSTTLDANIAEMKARLSADVAMDADAKAKWVEKWHERLRRVGYEVDQIPDLMNLAPPDKVSYARYL